MVRRHLHQVGADCFGALVGGARRGRHCSHRFAGQQRHVVGQGGAGVVVDGPHLWARGAGGIAVRAGAAVVGGWPVHHQVAVAGKVAEPHAHPRVGSRRERVQVHIATVGDVAEKEEVAHDGLGGGGGGARVGGLHDVHRGGRRHRQTVIEGHVAADGRRAELEAGAGDDAQRVLGAGHDAGEVPRQDEGRIGGLLQRLAEWGDECRGERRRARHVAPAERQHQAHPPAGRRRARSDGELDVGVERRADVGVVLDARGDQVELLPGEVGLLEVPGDHVVHLDGERQRAHDVGNRGAAVRGRQIGQRGAGLDRTRHCSLAERGRGAVDGQCAVHHCGAPRAREWPTPARHPTSATPPRRPPV